MFNGHKFIEPILANVKDSGNWVQKSYTCTETHYCPIKRIVCGVNEGAVHLLPSVKIIKIFLNYLFCLDFIGLVKLFVN